LYFSRIFVIETYGNIVVCMQFTDIHFGWCTDGNRSNGIVYMFVSYFM